MKFKKGDVVIANSLADDRYSITKSGWKGKVILMKSGEACSEYSDMRVRELNSCCEYDVHSKYFDLVAHSDRAASGYKKLYIHTGIKRVIFNEPATIVFWEDDSKTVVKCQKGDTFDKEKGLALCIAKRALSNKSNFNNTIKAWIEEK